MDFHPIQKIKAHIAKLRADMKPMTPREKLDHLWTYYKWVLVVLTVIIVIICVVVTGYKNAHTELVFSGVIINTNVTLDGQNFLDTEFFDYLDGEEKNQKTYLINLYYEDPETTSEIDYAYQALQKIQASLSVQELDYMIGDLVGVRTCMNFDALMDLRKVLTEEELRPYEEANAVLYLEYADTGEKIPVALELNDHPFAASGYLESTQDTYLAFFTNTPRLETCRIFWEYISAIEPASEAE